MKKILSLSMILLLSGIALTSFAQQKGKIRAGLDLGYAMPTGGGGVLFGIEPKYCITDNINVGVRYATALLAKKVGDQNASVSSNASILAVGDYYFHKSGGGSFAPFVGGGLGMFSIASVSLSVSSTSLDIGGGTSSKFGGLIRGGLEAGKFRLAIEYNLVPKTTIKMDGVDATGATTTSSLDIKNGYLGITVGFFVGGGKWSGGSAK